MACATRGSHRLSQFKLDGDGHVHANQVHGHVHANHVHHMIEFLYLSGFKSTETAVTVSFFLKKLMEYESMARVRTAEIMAMKVENGNFRHGGSSRQSDIRYSKELDITYM
ncbi:unnamed protein product [Sphenostylis stenocarpa]|uniref:Uncharacterized protein n=1 Tax=Sphenostylis stenocarpa TaxID=92480 RepID=A0AA86S9K8_9FABA|nr:unnamed protein product [Sphenostylis stenocarpa]